MNKEINIIAAKSKNNIIGSNNKLLWRIPADMKFFKETTWDSIVVMGRKTLESIGKPLNNRLNLVLTKNKNISELYKEYDNVLFFYEYGSLLEYIKINNDYKRVFIIGGGEIYRYFIENNLHDNLYITEIENLFNGDTYFPHIEDDNYYKKYPITSGEYNGIIYNINLYSKL